MMTTSLRNAIACAGLLACSSPAKPTTAPPPPPPPTATAPEPVPATATATPPTHAASDETLAFDITEGDIANHFFRRGPVAVHVLVSSGTNPRLIYAFPAGNTGAGVWFEPVASRVTMRLNGALAAVERADGMRGVSGLIEADTPSLTIHGAVLGSIRTLRDYAQLHKAPPEVAHKVEAGPPVVLRRVTADGKHHVELVLEPRGKTTATVRDGQVALAAPGGAISVQVTALADDEPLTPIASTAIVTSAAAQSPRDLQALAFLTYKEKLLAGSWRFLTYFGRDTLLSTRLLMPVLQPEVTEAALGAVIERLADDGDVAHEEDIGDHAGLAHSTKPIYDYKMVDDDFMLAPVLATYLFDTAAGRTRGAAFLARKTSSGLSYADAVARNLQLVQLRAKPFADKPSATTLVAIKAGIAVGEWRDSNEGLGGGRYPFDVNVALVPAALEAAVRLYESPLLGRQAEYAARASTLLAAWKGAEHYFHVKVPAAEATSRVTAYAKKQGIDGSEAAASVRGGVELDAIALDAKGKPIPVMNTDDGFVLLFGAPPAEYLDQVAGRLTRPFPAGLRTPVGMVVANPAFVSDAKLQGTFTRAHYHGTVVWSWQQAMLAAGLARQLERQDLPAATRAALVQAQQTLWDVIDAMAAQRTGELWTWDVKDHRIVYAPFGPATAHADESNAAQLWSTVYLSVQRPAKAAP